MRICFFGSISRSSCLPRSRISGRITHRAARGPTTPLFTPELSLPHPYSGHSPAIIHLSPFAHPLLLHHCYYFCYEDDDALFPPALSLTWRESSLACREKKIYGWLGDRFGTTVSHRIIKQMENVNTLSYTRNGKKTVF
ncbi:hypothetical protein CEXT_42311 [Caerostris extrusa]|uniref:Uncharacterized protein n=1 Tax=Caerostris extrusa TaxID=172846 RepID=A0AAV4PU25_CAEEX|nr:hypothetical protein CEXT_42311 [Caerostris extrusa]